MSRLIREIKILDNVAFRAGELSFDGWTIKRSAAEDIIKTGRALAPDDFAPDLKQKGDRLNNLETKLFSQSNSDTSSEDSAGLKTMGVSLIQSPTTANAAIQNNVPYCFTNQINKLMHIAGNIT